MPPKTKKLRADLALVERGVVASRAKAQALILAGAAFVDESRIEKAGELVAPEARLWVKEQDPYVSRGGHKLAGALADLNVVVDGRVVVDVGASTGGFSDCALQHGAKRVFAVDVGHGLLAEKLRQDPRVVVMERTNARHLTRDSFPEPIELALVDASFIGLEKLLPALAQVLGHGAQLLALIKPQFEVGKEEATRHRGVIRDAVLRSSAIERVKGEVEAIGFHIEGAADCRVPGPKGNVEHFVLATRAGA